jgi:hypothetical protein
VTQDNDPEADFWLHVGNAFEAGEDVDIFDLHSEDPASAAKFHELTGKANEAAVELIEYIFEHKDQLLEKLKGEG